MWHIYRVTSVLVVVALLLSACAPVALRPEATTPAPESVPVAQMPRTDAPPYGERGPFAVGVQDFVIEPEMEGERPIPVSVWYPALNPDGRPETVTYMLDFNRSDFPDFAIAGRALQNAEPDASGGPYPLIVYSHGYWLFRQVSSFLLEHLASHGFVVIAGDHMDNWGSIFNPQVEDYVIRPQEVNRKIDFAESLNSAGATFAGLIDLEQVGVTGHSFGADTALMLGGALLNTDVFLNEWCAMYPGDPADPLNDCAAMPAKLDQMAALAGSDSIPDGIWPDWSDPRVDAIVPLAPGAQYFGKEGLAAVRVPIMLFESTRDWAQSAASAYYDPYRLLPTNDKTHVVFVDGDHGLYLNACTSMPGLIPMGFDWICQDAVWDMERAHDLVNHFATAFLLAELKGDQQAAAALAPENVSFPGIEYETTAYTAAAAPEAVAVSALDPALVDAIEALVEQTMAGGQVPGLALGIMQDGALVYAQGYGVANLDTGEPITPQTLFDYLRRASQDLPDALPGLGPAPAKKVQSW